MKLHNSNNLKPTPLVERFGTMLLIHCGNGAELYIDPRDVAAVMSTGIAECAIFVKLGAPIQLPGISAATVAKGLADVRDAVDAHDDIRRAARERPTNYTAERGRTDLA